MKPSHFRRRASVPPTIPGDQYCALRRAPRRSCAQPHHAALHAAGAPSCTAPRSTALTFFSPPVSALFVPNLQSKHQLTSHLQRTSHILLYRPWTAVLPCRSSHRFRRWGSCRRCTASMPFRAAFFRLRRQQSSRTSDTVGRPGCLNSPLNFSRQKHRLRTRRFRSASHFGVSRHLHGCFATKSPAHLCHPPRHRQHYHRLYPNRCSSHRVHLAS